jgi:hypothetical protein
MFCLKTTGFKKEPVFVTIGFGKIKRYWMKTDNLKITGIKMRTAGKIFLLMLSCTFSAFAGDNILQRGDDVKLIFEFKGDKADAGWSKTKQITVLPRSDNLELNGNGWDAKIYRFINLPAGYYLVTACGKGKSIRVQIAKDFSAEGLLFDINLSRDDWRTDWRPFRLEKPMKLLLLVRASASGPVISSIKYIRIEQAHEVVETGIPSVAELEKQRPQPAIVRGCTSPGYKDFSVLQSWDANVVRKWISLKPESYTEDGLAEYGNDWEKQLDQLEPYLQAARAAKIKVVLTEGGGVFGKDTTTNKFWNNPNLSTVVCKVWRGIAKRLLPYRDVIYGYDLYNEPLDWSQMPNPPRQWRDIAKNTIKAIREVDKETWIIYESGPGGLCWGFAGMKPLPDSRIIYSGHFYNPHEFTHQGVYNIKGTDLAEIKAKIGVRYPGEVNGLLWNKEQIKKDLAPIREFQLKYHVPILIGEFSVIRWAPKEDAVAYLRDVIDICEEYQWSWIYHGFREWHGWSVENDETFAVHDAKVVPAKFETERAKIIKRGLARNGSASQ